MPLYIGDQNQVVLIHESGTYANTSGTAVWIGQVQNHVADDSENIRQVRYVGGGNRNVDQFVDGPLDHAGTLTFFPQDLKLLGFALGSIVDRSGLGPGSHVLSESNSNDGNAFTSGTTNPFLSFTIEDAQVAGTTGSNFLRTLQGCTIDTYSLSASEGDIVSCEVGYRAQSNDHSSGAVTAVTATTDRPFLWSDIVFNSPSGTRITNVKNFTFTVNNNLKTPHYLNGSRTIDQPIPLNRDYELSLTVDNNPTNAQLFYSNNFRSGNTFNILMEMTDASFGVGSRDHFISMSGCRIMDVDSPTPNEDVDELTATIAPQSVSAVSEDTVTFYNIF